VKLIGTPKAVSVEVSDQGVGMSEEVQRHIFEKFYQADHTRGVEGNGLGLTLVRRILDLSGGEISVTSAPGRGAVFTVVLPGS
jgi:signal transduction histidine kinase